MRDNNVLIRFIKPVLMKLGIPVAELASVA